MDKNLFDGIDKDNKTRGMGQGNLIQKYQIDQSKGKIDWKIRTTNDDINS